MSESKPKGRWKKRIITLVVLAGVGLFLARTAGYFESQHGFQEESSEVFRLLTSGSEGATQLYENASILFQESRLLIREVDRAERLTKIFGTFEAIESVEEIEIHKTIHGKTARIEYMLRFSHGIVTPGQVSLIRHKGSEEYKLLGYDVDVPTILGGKVKEVDSETSRIVAPPEVRTLLKNILADTAKGLGDSIYREASLPFKESSSEQQFQNMLAGLGRELGLFRHVLEITGSGHNASKTRAKITAILQYEEARTTGTFEFIRVENEAQWRLLRFKVLIPPPLIPQRAAQ